MGNSSTSVWIIGIMIGIVIVCMVPMGEAQEYKRPSKYSFFMHNTLRNGSSPTFTNVVTAAPDLGPEYWQFGMLTVFEDPITKSMSIDSEALGFGRGLYLYDSQAVQGMFFVFTAVINNTEYNGTIDIMGQNPTRVPGYRYLCVVGGTGDFFLARGLAGLQYLGSTFNPTTNQTTWVVSFDLDLYY